jgi:hypothetical protein
MTHKYSFFKPSQVKSYRKKLSRFQAKLPISGLIYCILRRNTKTALQEAAHI